MSDLITMMSAAAGQVGGINPREHFNTVLWTGTGSNQSIAGVGFQPDFVWGKARSDAVSHALIDAVRGSDKWLESDTTDAEGTNATIITSFDTDGFSVGTQARLNNSGSTYVAWNWKANGAGSSNTAGSIPSTVSANTTAGISIVSYTGDGGNNATVGHGLGVAPKMVIVKNRIDTTNWAVWHGSEPTKAAYLNETTAFQVDNFAAYGFNEPNASSTFPTSSVFYVSASGRTFNSDITNGNGESIIAYCFAEVEGFSKFGSYTGNGSATGPSVTTDFQPTWLMIKRTDSTGDWILLDSARDATNPRTEYLEPNTADAEATGNDVDFNSTGFQLKSTSASINASGGTYIYACFA